MVTDFVEYTCTSTKLKYWLEQGKGALVLKKENHPSIVLFRFEKEPGIEYLYAKNPFMGNRNSWDDKVGFAGIYAHERGLFFTDDAWDDYLGDWAKCSHDDQHTMSVEISRQINRYVESTIQNDHSKLSIHEGLSRIKALDYQYYLEHGARRDAIELLFKGQKPDTQFHSRYEMAGILDEEVFLAYLKNSEAVIKEHAERYIASHQEQLLLQFSEMEALQKAYGDLMNDAANPVHRMKAITEAVEKIRGKTVNVTVFKDGQEMTFRTAAHSLKGYRDSYNSLDIQSADRQRFEAAFGRYADYTADEITRITYGRNTIYQAAPVMDEDVSHDMEQSM